jgi:hypothetical protein
MRWQIWLRMINRVKVQSTWPNQIGDAAKQGVLAFVVPQIIVTNGRQRN